MLRRGHGRRTARGANHAKRQTSIGARSGMNGPCNHFRSRFFALTCRRCPRSRNTSCTSVILTQARVTGWTYVVVRLDWYRAGTTACGSHVRCVHRLHCWTSRKACSFRSRYGRDNLHFFFLAVGEQGERTHSSLSSGQGTRMQSTPRRDNCGSGRPHFNSRAGTIYASFRYSQPPQLKRAQGAWRQGNMLT